MTMAIQEPKLWSTRGACKGDDPEIYWPATGNIKPPDDVSCFRCEVREQCLEWALKQEDEGVWGGTTAAQRRSMKRPRPKVRCIGCQSEDILAQEKAETCLSCGLSWPI